MARGVRARGGARALSRARLRVYWYSSSIATRREVHPVTDDASHYEEVGGWSVDRIGRSLLELPDEGAAKDVVLSLAFMLGDDAVADREGTLVGESLTCNYDAIYWIRGRRPERRDLDSEAKCTRSERPTW
jgi:hypothetical protein